MRVMLVSPGIMAEQKFATFANGILYIAAVLEKNGHQVKILDYNIDSRRPADFTDFDPQVVGLAVASGPSITDAITLSQEFKKALPGAKIIWGGTHPSALPEQTVAEPYIDFVAVGAGEYTMLELVNRLEKDPERLDDIKGLVFKRQGRVIRNEPRPFIEDLNELPDPAWHLVDVSKYWVVSLNTSRGCPYKCTFCYNPNFHKGYRADLPVERIISQIETLKKRYGVKVIRFFEDNFTFNRKRLREFCNEVIARKLKFKWDCEARADLTEEEIALMAKAGCVSVGLGVETGSPRMLRFLKKGMNLAQMERALWFFVRHKISPRIYIMHALPTETIDDFTATHQMLARLDFPPYLFMHFVPYPGAPLSNYCFENGLAEAPGDVAGWASYLTEAGLSMNLSELPDELVLEVRNNFIRTYTTRRLRFALKHRPGFLITGIRHPAEFFKMVKDLFKASLFYMNRSDSSRKLFAFDVLKAPAVAEYIKNHQAESRAAEEPLAVPNGGCQSREAVSV